MNHQPAGPHEEGISERRKPISHEQLAITILTIVLTWVAADILFLTILAERAVLGPNFSALVISSFIAGGALTVAINGQLKRLTSNYQLFIEWGKAPTRKLLIFLCSASAVIAASLTVLIISNGLANLKPAGNTNALQEKFHVVLHGEQFDQHRLRRTLDEFEDARTKMEKEFQWGDKAPPISLHLYPDIESYHDKTGLTLSLGSMQCFPGGAVISAPLERIPNLITGSDGSSTPMHEMVHGAVCQILGPDFHQIPDWFHEGTAELIRTKQETRFIRIFDRMRVWLAGTDNAPSPDALCAGPPGDTAQERRRFYMITTEFVRFLESKHGPGSLNNVIRDVSRGLTFDESLSAQLGGNCQELYAGWLKTW